MFESIGAEALLREALAPFDNSVEVAGITAKAESTVDEAGKEKVNFFQWTVEIGDFPTSW